MTIYTMCTYTDGIEVVSGNAWTVAIVTDGSRDPGSGELVEIGALFFPTAQDNWEEVADEALDSQGWLRVTPFVDDGGRVSADLAKVVS